MTSLPQVDLPPATGQLVGYIRVSTDHQTQDAQRDALQALGVSRIFADKMSGARDDRTGYRALLDYVRPGDTIVVTALDGWAAASRRSSTRSATWASAGSTSAPCASRSTPAPPSAGCSPGCSPAWPSTSGN